MKVHEYNEMMRWLTRPKVDPRDAQLAASVKPKPGWQHAPWQDYPQDDDIPSVQKVARYNTQQYLTGGRVGKKPGGLVEPGVTHYAKKKPDVLGRVGYKKGTPKKQLSFDFKAKKKPTTVGEATIDFIVEKGRQPKPSEVLQIKEKLKPLIEKIGCPGLAAGGRVGFADGSRCFNKGLQVMQTKNITSNAQARNIVKLSKAPKSLLTKLLGPYGVGIDVVFEAGMIGTDVLKGKPLNEAVADNWLAGSVYKTFTGKTGQKLFNERLAKMDSSTKLYGDTMNLSEDIDALYTKLERLQSDRQKSRTKVGKEAITKIQNEIVKKQNKIETMTKGGDLTGPGTPAYEAYHSAAKELRDKDRATSPYSKLGPTVSREDFVSDRYQLREKVEPVLPKKEPLDLPTRGDISGVFQKLGYVHPIGGEVPKEYADELITEEKWRQLMGRPEMRGFQERFFGNTGGRVGLKKGKMPLTRRAFLGWLASLIGGAAGIKTGLIGFGKGIGKGKTVIKAGDHIIQGTPGMPDWFIPLVNRIVKEGDDVTKKLGTIERETVHTKKIEGHDVDVYQNLDTGNIRVSVEGQTGKNLTAYDEGLQLEYTAPMEDITSKGKPFKTKSDFSVEETEAGYYRTGPDDADLDVSPNIQGQPLKFDRKKGTYVVDETKATTDGILSDTNFLKNYAKKKKPNMGQIVETTKKKKEIKYLNKNPHEDPRIPEFDDSGMDELYDDFGNYIGD